MVGYSTILKIVALGAVTISFVICCDRLSKSFNCAVPVYVLSLLAAEFCRIARGDCVDALLLVYVVVPPRHSCYLSNLLVSVNA
jgi:hypothetical protein